MTQHDKSSWLDLCRQECIDPDEVRLVFERYDAYRQFNQSRAGQGTSLPEWFRFYRLEKSTDTAGEGQIPSGCSADGDAVNNACLHKPAEFLRVLTVYSNGGASG